MAAGSSGGPAEDEAFNGHRRHPFRWAFEMLKIYEPKPVWLCLCGMPLGRDLRGRPLDADQKSLQESLGKAWQYLSRPAELEHQLSHVASARAFTQLVTRVEALEN